MCINCDDNSTNIPLGNNGVQGPKGNDGNFGGYCGKWTFSSATLSGPAVTQIRLNNATYSAVSSIFINDTNFDSINYQAFLNSFANSGNFGYIGISKEFDSSVFWLGEVTAVTDNGADHSIDVTFIMSNGSFTDLDNLIICFSGKGYVNVYGKQRINASFRGYMIAGVANIGPYYLTSANTLQHLATMTWDGVEFGPVTKAKMTVTQNGIGTSLRARILDKNNVVLWDTTHISTVANIMETIDLGIVLATPPNTINYLDIWVSAPDLNTILVHSIDIYNG